MVRSEKPDAVLEAKELLELVPTIHEAIGVICRAVEPVERVAGIVSTRIPLGTVDALRPAPLPLGLWHMIVRRGIRERFPDVSEVRFSTQYVRVLWEASHEV